MKKTRYLVAALLLSGLLLTGCNPSSSGSGGGGGGGDPIEPAEKYVIRVTAPGGIDYSLDKEQAEKGETVTLTINSVASGMTITKVTMNNTTLTSSDSGHTYSFKMPNQSALINIEVDVQGEVTLVGEVSAVLTKGTDGIYVAKNVAVPVGTTKMANFSYRVGDAILDSSELDENECYADVTFYLGKEYSLEIARGFTYDFYYDPTAQMSCYVKRVSLDYLPATEEGLYALFEGSYRSETTVNYENLKGYTYKITDRSDSENPYKVSEVMKMYEGNVMYNVVEDIFDEKTYYQYKHYDEENATYEIVDTFPTNRGNNEYDRTSSRSAFSARYDVLDDSNYDFKHNNGPDSVSGRGATAVRAVKKSLTHGAHYGYDFEREFMHSYRVGFSTEVTYKRDISSVKDATTGVITTTVDSYIVYDTTASSTSIDRHEVLKHDLVISFTPDGAPLTINYNQTSYKLTDWNSTDGTPNIGAEGSLVKKIEGTFEYGNPYSGAPSFDKSKYFVSSIEKIRFYNAATGKPSTDGNSYLHYQDKINLDKLGDNDSMPNLKEYTFAPATALDSWQFGPIASSDESIVEKTETDWSYAMTCVGIGDVTVTFGNYTKNSPTYNLQLNVSATQKFHTIYLYSKWGEYASIGTDSSTSAKIVAGEVTSFKVAVTPSNAPVVYTATSERPELLAITHTGEKLTLDATGAANITEATVVRVRLDSDWFQEGASKKYEMFEFTIIPATADPTNSSWAMVGYEDHIRMSFTNEAYTGSAASAFTAPLKGTITDDGYQDNGTYLYSITINFYYQYKAGEIMARVYAISFSANPDGWSTSGADYEIDFFYDVVNKTMGLYVAEREYDSDIEWFNVYSLYGDCDEDGEPYSYAPFSKVEANA